jgi:hypothetical protein
MSSPLKMSQPIRNFISPLFPISGNVSFTQETSHIPGVDNLHRKTVEADNLRTHKSLHF